MTRPRGISRIAVVMVVSLMIAVAADFLLAGVFEPAWGWLLAMMAVAVPLGIGFNLARLPQKVRRMFIEQPAYAAPCNSRGARKASLSRARSHDRVCAGANLFAGTRAGVLLSYIAEGQRLFVPARVLTDQDIDDVRRHLLAADVPGG